MFALQSEIGLPAQATSWGARTPDVIEKLGRDSDLVAVVSVVSNRLRIKRGELNPGTFDPCTPLPLNDRNLAIVGKGIADDDRPPGLL